MSKFLKNQDSDESQSEEEPKNQKKSRFMQSSDENSEEEEQQEQTQNKKSRFMQDSDEDEDSKEEDNKWSKQTKGKFMKEKEPEKEEKQKPKSRFQNISDSDEEDEEEEEEEVKKEEPKVEQKQNQNKKQAKQAQLSKKQLAAQKKKEELEFLEQLAKDSKPQEEEKKEEKKEVKKEVKVQEPKKDADEEGDKKLSKGQKKKLKEKEKQKQQDGEQKIEEKKDDKKKGKKGPQVSAAAKRAAELQAAIKEQERIAQQEKEEEEERERQRQIKEKEEAEKKKLEKAKKKEQKKKEAELLKKQQQEEKRQRLLQSQQQVQQQIQKQKEELKQQKADGVEAEKPKQKKWKKKDQYDLDSVAKQIATEVKKEEVEEKAWDEFSVSGDEEEQTAKENKQEESKVPQMSVAQQKQEKKQKAQEVELPKDKLRSPIICIMGHVDTGKTTLLDKLRNTHVQENEAGGITQQIGATFFPGEKLISESRKCVKHYPVDVKIPGLLIIDTPGHEAFANLRSRGSSLADFAILVIDLMHGLENQTIESLNMLKERKTPFVIALNKIDVCYGWKKQKMASSIAQLNRQDKETMNDFKERYQRVITQINQLGMNCQMFYEIPASDLKTTIPIVPTSGHSGEGIPDLLSVIIKYTSIYMEKRIHVRYDQFRCTIMEKKMIDGYGYTIDCILIDGVLKQNDTIMLMGFSGPIKTKIRALLTPHPMKEMRVKGEYVKHDVVFASNGIKIAAPDLEEAVAGSQLYIIKCEDDEYDAQEELEEELVKVKGKIKLSDAGIGVAASTLGSLEALLVHLDKEKVPVSYTSVGPVSRDDVQKALKSVIADEPNKRKMEYCCMLVFDVKVLPDAQKYAEENQIKIMTANIIYHLTDEYSLYIKQCKEERQKAQRSRAVFPCLIKVIAIIRTDPLILGINVEKGKLKLGTPVSVFDGKSKQMRVGTVQTMEKDKKSLQEVNKNSGDIAIRIDPHKSCQPRKIFEKDTLCSFITRDSIDCLKEYFKDQVSMDEWGLIKNKLKPFFQIL